MWIVTHLHWFLTHSRYIITSLIVCNQSRKKRWVCIYKVTFPQRLGQMQLRPGSIKEARSSTSRFLPELNPVSSSSSRSASCRRSQTPRPRLGMRSSWIKGELQVVGRSSSTYYQYHLGGSLFQVHGPSGFCSSSRTVSAVRHSRRGQLCSEHNVFNLSGEILFFLFLFETVLLQMTSCDTFVSCWSCTSTVVSWSQTRVWILVWSPATTIWSSPGKRYKRWDWFSFFQLITWVSCFRWEDLAGDVQVCECCSTKCKGPAVRHLIEGQCCGITGTEVFLLDFDCPV